jgi:DNA-binding NarL/FixJ family response regulator
MNAWPWLARTQYRYGAFLLGSAGGDEQDRGRSLLREAEQLAGRLDMEALIDDISVALRGSQDGSAYPDGLTAREIEVLRLIAMGRSNKDISAVLAISLNTVATHVRSILNKTHCANRTEAAAYAIHQGLHSQGRE